MKLKEKRFLVLYGPTGVGKTDIALTLADRIPSEIINMDMGQCYTPLTIGTAKPDWRSMKTPHHLFDIVDEPRNITVVQYRAACIKMMHEIWDRGHLPILVGGSGFYLQSLFFPPQDQEIVRINNELIENGDSLWDILYSIDPVRASMIHPNDTYRLKRAISIWQTTGKKPSECVPAFDPPAAYTVHCLLRERDELYQRIDKRVHSMLQEGWIDETKKLLGTSWPAFLYSKKLIGYPDILDYLSGDQSIQSMNKMINMIQQKTRNYAKRQMTFWRKFERDLEVQRQINKKSTLLSSQVSAANLTLSGVDLYIKQLLKKVDTWFA